MTNIERANRPERKKIRLDRDLYMTPYAITSITICTLNRQCLFSESDFATELIESLRHSSLQHKVAVILYCFMPDHVHLLVQNGEGTDLVRFINAYKSWTTRVAWKCGCQGKIWQRSFFDHVLESEDDVARHLVYIAENPIRAGLVDVWNEYPLTGSFEYDLQNFDW